MKILYIGNSLTLHSVAPQIGWHHEHGMAASAIEKDYVHRLTARINERGIETEIMVRNCADFERCEGDFDHSYFEEMLAFDADVLVIRLCENCPGENLQNFGKNYCSLLSMFAATGHTFIVAAGSFWKNDVADEMMKKAAEKNDALWVSLESLHDQKYQAIGQFEHAGVAAHPSDLGMDEISRIIFEAMDSAGLFSPVIAPLPKGEEESHLYNVLLNGQKAQCMKCRVSAMSFNREWPGQQRPLDQTEEAAFVSFEMKAPTDLTVELDRSIGEATVRPLSKNVKVKIDGNRAKFTLPCPGQYTFEADGRHCALHIFADAPDPYSSEKEKAEYYFAPGVHHPGDIVLHSGETMYIDRGAVVHASITVRDSENVRILGRGVLDNSEFPRGGHRPLTFDRCRNVTMEGITIRDSSEWTITSFNCVGMDFCNLKAIGMWRYNSDGFDYVNCQNILLRDSFLRTFDDAIVFKGLYNPDANWEKMSLMNYVVENCVIWCDWGGALEIGAETVADEYANIIYRNIDIIRNDQGGLRIHSGDRADIHNVTYDNIRVEYSKYDRHAVYQRSDDMKYEPADVPSLPEVIHAFMYCGRWSPYMIPGHVHDITYRNISVIADEGIPMPKIAFEGADSEHCIERITIDGVTFNGVKVDVVPVCNEFAHP